MGPLHIWLRHRLLLLTADVVKVDQGIVQQGCAVTVADAHCLRQCFLHQRDGARRVASVSVDERQAVERRSQDADILQRPCCGSFGGVQPLLCQVSGAADLTTAHHSQAPVGQHAGVQAGCVGWQQLVRTGVVTQGRRHVAQPVKESSQAMLQVGALIDRAVRQRGGAFFIRKTLLYTITSALLALIFFGGVILLQRIFRAVTGQQSQLAIVLSTLAIAAIFNPLRRCIQDWINRCFYRKKYDAQRVLAQFALAARDKTDVNAQATELARIVDETLQPERVRVWLRDVKSPKGR